MQKLRQYLAEVVDTDLRFRNRCEAIKALGDMESDGIVQLAILEAHGQSADRLKSLLTETWNAQR